MVDLTGATWRKSSRSGSNGGACVEVADAQSVIAVRDSKHPHHPHLTLTRHAFSHFANSLKRHS